MRPVSDRFLRTLRGSHSAVVEAWVVEAGQTGVEPVGTLLDVIAGDVELDASADIRSTLDITLKGGFPQQSDDVLAPYGAWEIFVRRGIGFGGGSVEWVSLGYFRPHSVEEDEDEVPGGPVQVIASDRMRGIVKARLTAPVQFASTATYGDVVEQLITEVYPWATIEWDDDTDTDHLGRALIAELERFEFLNDLVTGLGKIWFWDYRGVLVIKTAPDPSDSVFEVNSGEDGVLVAMGRDISDEGVYNAVVATGDALDTTAPPTAMAYDNNPNSPTYWNGSFGKVPRFYSSPFITTTSQAQTAANALLRDKLGVPYNVNFQSIVNPALEPYDPITVKFRNRNETHVLNRLTIPLLVEDAMRAETKEQTLVVIGEGDA